MKNFLLALSLFWISSPALNARQIPHYRMDSYALLSDAVVLCEEKKIDSIETAYFGGMKSVHNVILCRIIESFKGDLKAGSEIEITYDAVFARYRVGQNGYMDGSTNPPTLVKHKYAPADKAVLFLKKGSDGKYSVVTAKLIQGTEILQFIQGDNPGPLVLFPQKPEQVETAENKKYELKEFLEDVRLSVTASRNLKSAVQTP